MIPSINIFFSKFHRDDLRRFFEHIQDPILFSEVGLGSGVLDSMRNPL